MKLLVAMLVAWNIILWPQAPAVSGAEMPPAKSLSVTTSYYMNTADAATLTSMGCKAGSRTLRLGNGQDDLVILMFGAPKEQGGVEGATIYRGAGAPSSGFASSVEIEGAAKGFVIGYLNCSAADAKLSLVLGTSNWGTHVTRAHGFDWGIMTNDVAAWLKYVAFDNRVAVYGGNDIEVGWGKPEPARAWVDGYRSTGAPPLYHFGDAEGCPTSETTRTTCHNGWTQEDIWYMAWGSGRSVPVPQIYNGVYAKQWFQLKKYSLTKVKDGFTPMVIGGVLTMDGDCQQQGGCGPDFNFKPDQGYGALAKLLELEPSTAQVLRFTTDIRKAWLP